MELADEALRCEFVDITMDGHEIIKVKGLTKDAINSVDFKGMEILLFKDVTRNFNQEKWIKNLYSGEINVIQTAYQLAVTSNKRKPIYERDIFTHTDPFNYNEITNSAGSEESSTSLSQFTGANP